jgi:hypothetical protein
MERRDGDRQELNHPILVQLPVTQPEKPVAGHFHEIGYTGGRISVRNPWPTPRIGHGAIVQLRVAGHLLHLQGEIRWTRAILARDRNFELGLRWLPESTTLAAVLVSAGAEQQAEFERQRSAPA